MTPLPKGVIVTGELGGIVKISALLHADCLWILISTGIRTKTSSKAGYVQDVRCLRHNTVFRDVDGEFLRIRASVEQIEALFRTMRADHEALHHNLKFVKKKLQILKEM